jgi:hypothetical protein
MFLINFMKYALASLLLLVFVGKQAASSTIVGRWAFATMTIPGQNGASDEVLPGNDGSGIQFDDKGHFEALGKGGANQDEGPYELMDESRVVTTGKRSTDTVGVSFSGLDTMHISIAEGKMNGLLTRVK